MVLLAVFGLQLLFLASKFCPLVPADPLFVLGLMRRVDFGARFDKMFKPILNYSLQVILLEHSTLGSPYKIMYLALDAITVLTKNSPYSARLVVVIKARHYF